MASFSVELDVLLRKRQAELGRELTGDELEVAEGELYRAWLHAERFDELITKFLYEHGRDGGLVDCIVLGNALRKAQDVDRIHKLFRSLVTRRTNAFWQSWPKAAKGHIGHMRDAARYMAAAMDAFTEYFISLDALGLVAEKEALRAEMLALQDRVRPKKPK